MKVNVLDASDMRADEVHTVLDALNRAGCPAWIGGGWGVDALVGHQTRPHRDLDVAVAADREVAALDALSELGYVIETDWRPVRVEVVAITRGRVDLHPVAFDEAGDGHQAGLDGGSFFYPKACFTTGGIAGRQVKCLSVEQQLRFHSGYKLRGIDRADLALLRQLAAGTHRHDAGADEHPAEAASPPL
jgi:lincosamide nucleotidyltransferase A/C/D/E